MTASKRKRLLFVDDDASFLHTISELFGAKAGGSWKVLTADSHARALALLDEGRVDVVVLDISLPVMDGIQFLKLLGRLHPGQQVAMLTGRASQENRKTCMENGASLFLEKPVSPGGFDGVFSELDKLAEAAPQTGFRGMMRRVGLQDVLQMECLGRKSSVLEVFTAKARGKIFIEDGSIIHAESDALQGEVALYSLLALRGGEFNLLQFQEPPHRSISGQWEFLLMEAARLSDENAALEDATGKEPPPSAELITLPPSTGETTAFLKKEQLRQPVQAVEVRTRIEEIVLCSGAGEVLYEWGSKQLDDRLNTINRIELLAAQLGNLIPVGRFERLLIQSDEDRIVCEIQLQRRLFVRSIGPDSNPP